MGKARNFPPWHRRQTVRLLDSGACAAHDGARVGWRAGIPAAM